MVFFNFCNFMLYSLRGGVRGKANNAKMRCYQT